MVVEKVTKTNGTLVMKEIPYDVAKKMMVENHYSHKWNTSFGKINIGVFRDGELLGACVFGNLMNPNSHSKITDQGSDSVIELNRMWLDDRLGKNSETTLIGASFKIIKAVYPHIKFVQSFADGRLGCGTIYKASNFKYFGYDESLFFEDKISKEVFHKVPLENTKRPSGFLIKNRLYLDGSLRPFKVKTYKYIYQLDKKHVCKLKELPYPEYDRGEITVEYEHPIGLLTRLMMMYELIGDTKYSELARTHLQKRFTMSEVNDEIKKQLDNKSIKWFRDEYITNDSNVQSLMKGAD